MALSVCDPVYDDSVLHEEMRLVTRCRPRDMELGKLDFDSLSRVRSNPIEISFHYRLSHPSLIRKVNQAGQARAKTTSLSLDLLFSQRLCRLADGLVMVYFFLEY